MKWEKYTRNNMPKKGQLVVVERETPKGYHGIYLAKRNGLPYFSDILNLSSHCNWNGINILDLNNSSDLSGITFTASFQDGSVSGICTDIDFSEVFK